MSFEVVYFERRDGLLPALTFEDSIANKKLAGKLAHIVIACAQSGPALGGGYIEKCHSYPGLWEIRAIHGSDLGRLFCALEAPIMVLLSGVVKRKGEPTPRAALEEAARYLAEYKTTRNIRR